MRLLSLSVAACLLMTVHDSRAGDRIVGAPFATRSPVPARHGMVCASQPLAAQVGLEVLKDGGSAVDAAIAVNACLGLMEPTGCGVGGDLFAIVWDAEAGALTGYNGSGRSPRGLDLAELRAHVEETGGDGISSRSPHAVSVPGCVDGWFALHERHGRLPMARLLAPAIAYAREGFPLTQVIAEYWRRSDHAFRDFPEWRRVYLPGGAPPVEGQVFRNPDLADTYALLAEGGRDAFYGGAVAEDIVACLAERGGRLSLDDLAGHAGEWVDPVSVSYRGHEVWELPPNGQGVAALQILSVLEGYTLDRSDPLAWHRQLEAKKLAFEDRARFYADPDFAPAPLGRLLSPEYAAARRALVDDAAVARAYDVADHALEQGDTIYLTVADDDGNVVSWIQSNYTGFGSGFVPEGRGFVLQNRGKLFHLEDGHANVYAPGKRPFHTIIPAMMTREGRPVLSFGVMGGAMQPQGHAQIVVNMLDFGMNVQEAGDAPRWRHSGSSQPTGEVMTDGGRVHLESGVPTGIVEALADLGHQVTVEAEGYGGYQAIWIEGEGEDRVYLGASESRKDGHAVGY